MVIGSFIFTNCDEKMQWMPFIVCVKVSIHKIPRFEVVSEVSSNVRAKKSKLVYCFGATEFCILCNNNVLSSYCHGL